VQRIFQFVFWFAVAATLFFALRKVTVAIPTSDKTQHAVTFAVLTGLAALAYPRARLWAAAFALSGFGALIEFLQPYFQRDRDYRDWIADTIGILIVFAIVVIARKLRSPGRNSLV
jgi:VanZ family protein